MVAPSQMTKDLEKLIKSKSGINNPHNIDWLILIELYLLSYIDWVILIEFSFYYSLYLFIIEFLKFIGWEIYIIYIIFMQSTN